MNRNFADVGIVLKTKPYSEADKLVSIYSNDYGKITLLAKGVKRLKSKKRGSIEVFSHIRFSAYKSKGLPVIAEADIINNFLGIRVSLQRISVAYYYLEIVTKATQEEAQNDEIFELLLESLKELEKGGNLKQKRYSFATKISKVLGFIPEGQHVPNPDELLESIIEKRLSSIRVGKKLQ